MMPVGEAVLRVPTGLPVGEIDDLNLAVSVFWPESGEIAPRLFYCLPGGGMRRAYFDLGADPRLSFARQMAARGHVCLLVDHPGVGDSDRPQDGHLLTPDLVARLHARVLEQLLDRLGAGRIDPACPTIEYPRAVAVGHSMGAMIAVTEIWRSTLNRLLPVKKESLIAPNTATRNKSVTNGAMLIICRASHSLRPPFPPGVVSAAGSDMA